MWTRRPVTKMSLFLQDFFHRWFRKLKIWLKLFQYSRKADYGKVPAYITERKRAEEEAQREYDAYIKVIKF